MKFCPIQISYFHSKFFFIGQFYLVSQTLIGHIFFGGSSSKLIILGEPLKTGEFTDSFRCRKKVFQAQKFEFLRMKQLKIRSLHRVSCLYAKGPWFESRHLLSKKNFKTLDAHKLVILRITKTISIIKMLFIQNQNLDQKKSYLA